MTATHAPAPRASVPSIEVLMATPAQRAAKREQARAPFRTITIAAAARQGLTARRMTVEALYASLGSDEVRPMWERIGYVGAEVEYGVFHFRRYATENSTGVEVVRTDGTPVVRYPAGQGRYVRTLGRTA
jgi:hypothetical protein